VKGRSIVTGSSADLYQKQTDAEIHKHIWPHETDTHIWGFGFDSNGSADLYNPDAIPFY
jgi:hypothetical protein